MVLFLDQLFSSIFQVIFLGVAPFVWWLSVSKQKKENFFTFIGIKKITSDDFHKLVIISLISLVIFGSLGFLSLKLISDTSILANNKFNNTSVWGILSILLYAFVQTSLSEEIFFRGFLAKRFINKFGFFVGNLIQAFLFGLTHVLLMLTQDVSIIVLLMVLILTSSIGYVLCYIDERLAKGSILPSWLIHGFANVLSTFFLIFILK